jgi:hypothetical protein
MNIKVIAFTPDTGSKPPVPFQAATTMAGGIVKYLHQGRLAHA